MPPPPRNLSYLFRLLYAPVFDHCKDRTLSYPRQSCILSRAQAEDPKPQTPHPTRSLHGSSVSWFNHSCIHYPIKVTPFISCTVSRSVHTTCSGRFSHKSPDEGILELAAVAKGDTRKALKHPKPLNSEP